MKSELYNYRPIAAKGLQYFSLVITGLIIIFFCSLIQHVVIPMEQRDFSHFLNYNFTKTAAIVFFITGFLIGNLSQLNPCYTGICLFLVFPLTSLIEGTINKGSHNLIPFEFIMYFMYALPSIIAAFMGRFIRRQIANQKEKVEEKVVN